MQVIALLGTACFVVVGATVGARVLLLARRSGQLPELYLGGSLFLYAAVGQPFVVASRPLAEAFGYEARILAVAIALCAITTSMIALYLFTWTVFRPASVWAGICVWLAAAIAVTSGLTVLLSLPEHVGYIPQATRVGIAGLAVISGLGMSWTAWESFCYFAAMRKRLALGLADPVVANRFLLWGSGCSGSAVISLGMIGCAAAGLEVGSHPLPLLMTAISGTAIGACWYLAFLPPAGYLRWLRASAPAGAPAS